MAATRLDQVCQRLHLEVGELGAAAGLPDADAERLAELLERAIEQRDRELREAVDASVGIIPRPLRRIVTRVMRG